MTRVSSSPSPTTTSRPAAPELGSLCAGPVSRALHRMLHPFARRPAPAQNPDAGPVDVFEASPPAPPSAYDRPEVGDTPRTTRERGARAAALEGFRAPANRIEVSVPPLARVDLTQLLPHLSSAELTLEGALRPGRAVLPLDERDAGQVIELEVLPGTELKAHIGIRRRQPEPAPAGSTQAGATSAAPPPSHAFEDIRLELSRPLTILNPIALLGRGDAAWAERIRETVLAVHLQGFTVRPDGEVHPDLRLSLVQNPINQALAAATQRPRGLAELVRPPELPGWITAPARTIAGSITGSAAAVGGLLKGNAVAASVSAPAGAVAERIGRPVTALGRAAAALAGEVTHQPYLLTWRPPLKWGLPRLHTDPARALAGDLFASRGLLPGPSVEKLDLFGLVHGLGMMTKTCSFHLSTEGTSPALARELGALGLEVVGMPVKSKVRGRVDLRAADEDRVAATSDVVADIDTSLLQARIQAKGETELAPDHVRTEQRTETRTRPPRARRRGPDGGKIAFDLTRAQAHDPTNPDPAHPPAAIVSAPDAVMDGVEKIFEKLLNVPHGDRARYVIPGRTYARLDVEGGADRHGVRLDDGRAFVRADLGHGELHGPAMDADLAPGSAAYVSARDLAFDGRQLRGEVRIAADTEISGGIARPGPITAEIRERRYPHLEVIGEVSGGGRRPYVAKASYDLGVGAQVLIRGRHTPLGAQIDRGGTIRISQEEGVQIDQDENRIRPARP